MTEKKKPESKTPKIGERPSGHLECGVMPSKRKKHYVQFFFSGQDEPFICGVDGHFTSDILDEIQSEFLEENDESFSKGAGDYLFQVWRESDQIGEEGRIENPGYWMLNEVSFEPLEA